MQVNQELVSMQDLKKLIRINENIIKSENTNYGSNFDFPDAEKKLANIKNRLSQLEQKGVMMESQTLKFGESLKGISKGCNIITDNQANMDNHNPTEREKERAKILIEELKILQGVINKMAQNSLECKKWTLALAVGVLSLKIEMNSHLYGLCVLGVLLACFYLLDAYYLMLERLFREQYQ